MGEWNQEHVNPTYPRRYGKIIEQHILAFEHKMMFF